MKRIEAVFRWGLIVVLSAPLPLLAEPSAAPAAHELDRSEQASIDLWQLFQQAVPENPRSVAAQARSESGRWRQEEAFGQLLPQISASSAHNRSIQKLDGREREFYNNDRYMLSLSQVLYDARVWHNYQRFRELARQQDAEYVATLEGAMIDLVDRYFQALAAEDELELIQAELRATQRNQERVNSLYDKQLAMITDVLSISARVDALKAAEIEGRNKVEVSRESLSELVGYPLSGRLKRIGQQASFHMPPQDREYWVRQALSFNPILQARRKAVDAAQAALRQAKAGHLPSVNLNLLAQRSDIGYENSLSPRTDTYVASVGVQVPIFAGGSTRARVASSDADLTAAEQDLEAVQRQILRETRAAFHDVETGLSKIVASRKALESAEKSRQAAEKAFSLGVVNAVDLLNSVRDEYASRRNLLKSQYSFILSSAVLRRWSGTLVQDDIRKINEWLVPAGMEP